MQKLNLKHISTFLCAVATLLTPFHLAAAYQDHNACCQPPCQTPYYEEECNSSDGKKNGWWLLGAAALGAAAGAGAGYAASNGHRGHAGDSGPIGPQGPQGTQGPQGPGFNLDTGQSLAFSLLALFPSSPSGAVSATPFVTAPNGVTYEGAPLSPSTTGGTLTFAPIIVENPPFGFYNFGITISNTSTVTLIGISLNGTLVSATRDNSVTNELTPLAGVSIAPGESQISSTFTYDSKNVP